MKKLLFIGIFLILTTGCAGLGFNKSATVMPDEIWITGDTNPNEEDGGELGFGIKWKFK